MFSPKEIPSEAEPVKFAQSLFVLTILAMGPLNFVINGIFAWIFPISIPLAGYYAFTIHSTGYAIGRYDVHHRDRSPVLYNAHLWGAVGFMLLAFFAWIN